MADVSRRNAIILLGLLIIAVVVGYVFIKVTVPVQPGISATAALGLITSVALAIERFVEMCWLFWERFNKTGIPSALKLPDLDEFAKKLRTSIDPYFNEATTLLKDLENAKTLPPADLQKATALLNSLSVALADQTQWKDVLPGRKGELKFIAQLEQQLSELQSVAPQIYTQANTIVETMLSVREQASAFVRTIQDDTGRRLISIIVGALVGLVFNFTVQIDMFWAIFGLPSSFSGVVATGLMLGLGSDPAHQIMRTLQEIKTGKKIENSLASGSAL